jgi:hypothetical protein
MGSKGFVTPSNPPDSEDETFALYLKMGLLHPDGSHTQHTHSSPTPSATTPTPAPAPAPAPTPTPASPSLPLPLSSDSLSQEHTDISETSEERERLSATLALEEERRGGDEREAEKEMKREKESERVSGIGGERVHIIADYQPNASTRKREDPGKWTKVPLSLSPHYILPSPSFSLI